MVEYLVHEGCLYRRRGMGERTETAEVGTGGRLVVIRRELAEPVSLTSEVAVYAACDDCRPVLYLREGGGHAAWIDYVHERHPWCEWRLVFAAGRLERSDVARLDTRDAVRRELLAQGLDVLDDDDRLARMHFRRLEKQEA